MKITKIFWLFCMIVGICLYAFPIVSTEVIRKETNDYITEFIKKESKTKNHLDKENDPRYQEIYNYNSQIYEEDQAGFKSVASYQKFPISLTGFEDNKFGYIEIPKMDVKLALYLGATDSNLKKGTAILGQTSIPIGGSNTNCVIAGHRGYRGVPFFRDIEKLSKGDVVKIRNPWETLTYKVTGIAVIDPDDRDAVLIQEDKEMVTLSTCHPYRGNGRFRYLVYCTRKGTKPSDKGASTDTRLVKTSTFDIQREQNVRDITGIAILFIVVFVILVKIKRTFVIKKQKRQ